MDAELNKLEEELKKLSPLGMPDDMISRLDNAMARWHEQVPVEEKIVPLNQEPEEEKRNNWLGWRSVAAVAVMGAGLAFVSNGTSLTEDPPVVNSASNNSNSYGGIATTAFTPSDARARVTSHNNVGVIWTQSGQPVRWTEVNSTKTVSFKNDLLRQKVTVETPSKAYYFEAVEID